MIIDLTDENVEIYGDDMESINTAFGFYNQFINLDCWVQIIKCGNLTELIEFQKLKEIRKFISFVNNPNLHTIGGFDSLEYVSKLHIQQNPKLVSMSIPGNLVRSVDCGNGNGFGVDYDSIYYYYNSPEEFINSPVVIDDLVSKFNPGYHGDLVIQQIMDNLEEWGTEETKEKVYSHLAPFIIDDTNKHLFTQEILNKYHLGTIKQNNKIISEVFGD